MNMEFDDLQVTKRSRIDCAYEASSKVKHKENSNNIQDGVHVVGVNRKPSDGQRMTSIAGVTTTNNNRTMRLPTSNWNQHSSRICRVSRASGGKDRHSKVLTAKGLRDRRVRLSVSTAIQFYDLQDRLGVDQPSKAVEWLINAASAAISELPELDDLFLEYSDELMIADKKHREELKGQENDTEDDDDKNEDMDPQHQQWHLSITKSACSSTSETSKGSVLSLSHPIARANVKERAKERTSKDKERKDGDGDVMHPSPGSHYCNLDLHYHHNPTSQESFTELLTGHNSVTLAHAHLGDGAGSFHKQIHHLPVSLTADYFSQASPFGQGHVSHPPSGLPAQTLFGLNSSIEIMPSSAATTASGPREHADTQQFFLQDHLIPVAAVAATTGGEYNLNFSIPSGLYGFHRGTLQSNSQSTTPNYHNLQRISSPVDGSNLSFFLNASTPSAPTSGDNLFPAFYNSHLQLCSGDGYRKTDVKGKGKG